MESLSYPRLLRRVQAVLIDSLIVPITVIGLISFSGVIDIEQAWWIKAILLFGPIIILEPGLVAFTGGTVGHHLLKLKVRRTRRNKNIDIFSALIRFILKFFLGWLSLLTITSSKKHQAIHDFTVGSIVVNKSSQSLPVHESLSERIIEEPGYKYPSKLLRIFMAIIYSLVISILMIVLFTILFSIDCSESNLCLIVQIIVYYTIYIAWIISLGVIISYCWRSRVYGCRRKPMQTKEA